MALSFIGKWIGVLGLLALLVGGDQIRIHRPGHKYRLTVEVETPAGIKSASSVLAVVPDRGYSRGGKTVTRGEAVYVDLGEDHGQRKNLVALLAHLDKALDLDDVNYVALRAYGAARGSRVSFNELNRLSGVVPVQGALIPVLVTFGDPNDPATARIVAPDQAEAVLGAGYKLHGLTAEIVPNGLWPIDFGGVLGEPVTRGLTAKLPWLAGAGEPAAAALKAAGLAAGAQIEPKEVFARK